MAKNIIISEGTETKFLSGVEKLRTNLQGGGSQLWVPEDEAGDYVRLSAKTFRENGEYFAADDNVTGYKSVKVSVRPNTSSKSITVNGTYSAIDEGYDGYSTVRVNVSGGGGDTKLGTKTITDNGTYRASNDGFDGYSTVTVKTKTGGVVSESIGVMRDLIRGGVMDCMIGDMTGGSYNGG